MPGMNASDAPTVDELLLVAEGSVEFLFGTSRAALLQISLPLSTSESKAWLSSQNVDAKLAKVGRAISAAGIEEYALFLLISETVRGTIAESISRSRRSGGLGVLQRSLVPLRCLGPLCHEGGICGSADVGSYVYATTGRGAVSLKQQSGAGDALRSRSRQKEADVAFLPAAGQLGSGGAIGSRSGRHGRGDLDRF